MASMVHDINRIRNLTTKNAFVAHETSRRAWKTLTMLAPEDDLREDGYRQHFHFCAPPPHTEKWRQTPSLEDSDFSSEAPSVNARLANDESDDVSSPSTAHRDTAPSSPAPANADPNAPSSSTPAGDA